MLPKVATQILHSTSRAVSSIKPIRNVLHQSPCPGSSHRGPNSGGSARFNGAGRAVTQANPVISTHDGAFDDQDDPPPRRAPVPARIRSNSISARPSVLKAVKLHARASHAFAAQEQEDADLESPPPVPKSQSPPSQSHDHGQKTVSHAARRLLDARLSGNSVHAAEVVREFRQSVVNPSVREFNAALQALQATRRPGEPLDLLLETYNDMLRHSLLPNPDTYIALIDSLTARDQEVHSAITALERRINQRALGGFVSGSHEQADRKRIDVLRHENNFNTAMSLFETLLSIGGNKKLGAYTYTSLLRSCAINSNIDAAIHVWAQFEQRDDYFPNPAMFLEMIRVYTNTGQLAGAEEIFAEYRSALHSGKIHLSWSQGTANPNRLNLLVWNQMIETYFRHDRADKAVALVDQMLQADMDNLQNHVVTDPPPVSSATMTTVITGFCQSGDIQTALVWFERLLAQGSFPKDPFEPVGQVTKPDEVAWDVILDTLAGKRMTDDLNRLFKLKQLQSPRRVRTNQRAVVFSANMARLHSLDDAQFLDTLDWLLTDVLTSSEIGSSHHLHTLTEVSNAYMERKMYDKALHLLSSYVNEYTKAASAPVHGRTTTPVAHVQELHLKFTDKLYEISNGDFPYSIAVELARLAVVLRISQPPRFIPFFLQSYALSRAAQNLPITAMTRRDWELLLMAASSFESISEDHDVPNFAYQGLASLIRDLATFKVDFYNMDKNLVRSVIDQLSQRLGSEGMLALLEETGFANALQDADQYLSTIKDSASETSGADSGYASDAPSRPFKIDKFMSRTFLDELKLTVTKDLVDATDRVFPKFKAAAESGRSPNIPALSLLIRSLGRLGRMEDMQFAYNVAQSTLKTFENDKVLQTNGWFDIEDAMVIGFAQHGDSETANMYRQRIFAHGGVPSAEAYGALIFSTKETTDDASAALELFNESQKYRVVPNQYLYNNIISKLAKARKTDYAMELFRQMKEVRVLPTSVSYGAVIGACARVGDYQSAEVLFKEMRGNTNFFPRIPPFNTMIQMYTTVKPDRSRALYYYKEMRKEKIFPSAHTYKLLLDAYGTIEPVDLEKMESTFRKIKEDKRVAVQGVHYAALINAYGCVSKDLDKALVIFNTMSIPPEPIVYETLFNVLTVHRREDLISRYLSKMHLEGVHMTAYIANSLIKGYSLLGNMEEARKLFESLEDPPEGVAASNNHAPHSPLEGAPPIDPNAPVYREPSTWEAMFRAELGSGNRDGALALLERLKARQVFFASVVVLWLIIILDNTLKQCTTE
ncbi:hypothetical protein C0992_002851 [Termitomyces sp. T32_za158]|nr:hypothetical protein C0992_002851 [Termitomyces sp. T32_za158]